MDIGFRAREFAGLPALDTPAGIVGYDELGRRVDEARRDLARQGCVPGERVAAVVDQDPDSVVRALALLEHGCCLLPLVPETRREERLGICNAFGAHWLWAQDAAPERRPAPAEALERSARRWADPPVTALLSSGSTGTPKIVLRDARLMHRIIGCNRDEYSMGPQDRVMALAPLAFAYGFHKTLLTALASGACIVFPSSRHPRSVIDEIATRGITLFGATPVFFDLLLRLTSGVSMRLGSLRRIVAPGDALPLRSRQTFLERFGVRIEQIYGCSETGPALIERLGRCEGENVALGQPFAGVEVELLDENERPVAEGEVGEIVVRSPCTALGYLAGQQGERPFDGERFFTGDLGCQRNGDLYFAGRIKIMINAAGRKVDPAEVEGVLRQHPAIEDVAVVGQREGEREWVKALIVSAQPPSAAELMEFCARSLADYKVPRLYEVRESLPRGATGKLLRAQLGTASPPR